MPFAVWVTVPIPESGLDLLRPHCETLDVGTAGPLSVDAVLQKVPRYDGVLCTISHPITRAVLSAARPRCKVFANFGVGTDHIDLAAAAEFGITITNTPGVLTDATADLTWALIMATARRVVEGDRLVRYGNWTGWTPTQMLGQEVTGATLGIVGAGRIGIAVALRSAGFRMNVLYVAHRDNAELNKIKAHRVSLNECLAQSDFVSLHTPLTPETRHMIGQAQLARMKPNAILINTSRGPVVDETALINALTARTIAAAGLDVYDGEPNVPAALTSLDNLVCLPHLGSATHTTRQRMGRMAAEDLLAVLRGEQPKHPVRP